MNEQAPIGIIGGSGLYHMPELDNPREVAIRTPYGPTSEAIISGQIAGHSVAFIARHGRGHRLNPTEVPYAANIYALKTLGVKYIIAVSACGSLREDIAPGDVVIPDQLVDQTHGLRAHTFFGDGLVAHANVGEPFAPELRAVLAEAAEAAEATVHVGGTYVTIEGPRYSTRAESETFRQLGYSIIGMTTSPEAFLAAEAEIAYGVFAHVTDYDVWHTEEASVSASLVVETFRQNLRRAQEAIIEAVPRVATLPHDLPVHHNLQGAIMTARDEIPAPTFERLRLLVGHYFAEDDDLP